MSNLWIGFYCFKSACSSFSISKSPRGQLDFNAVRCQRRALKACRRFLCNDVSCNNWEGCNKSRSETSLVPLDSSVEKRPYALSISPAFVILGGARAIPAELESEVNSIWTCDGALLVGRCDMTWSFSVDFVCKTMCAVYRMVVQMFKVSFGNRICAVFIWFNNLISNSFVF